MNNKLLLPRVCGLSVLAMTANASFAATAQEAVDSLAQRCDVIQSSATAEYVDRRTDVVGIKRYSFGTNNLANAQRFYMKPAALGKFLMTDKDGYYLSSRASTLEIALNDPEEDSEWSISATANGVVSSIG